MDSFETQNFETTTIHLGKKKDISPLNEADNSKEVQVELLLKDIKAATLKRVSLLSEKENQNNVLEDSHDENISNEQESLENTKPKITDQTSCLGQNGNSCICENLFGHLDNKKEQLENGMKNEVTSFRDENKDSSICDNITANIIQSSETSKDSSIQNGEVYSCSQEITYSEDDQKDTNHSEKKENDQNGSDKDIVNQKKLLSNNEDLSDVEISESIIENGENSMLINGSTENEEISLQLSKIIKNDSQKEPMNQTSMKEIRKVKVIEEITQENKKFKDFTDEPILSRNIATNKQPDCIEMMADKEPMDSENDDKTNSPNSTSSVSEEEDPLEEGICIIINGKRLPPSSESELESLRNSKENLSTANKDEIDPNQSNNSVFESIEDIIDVTGTAEYATNTSDQEIIDVTDTAEYATNTSDQEIIDVTDTAEYATNTSDQDSTSQENSINQSKPNTKTDILSAILDMTSKRKSGKANTSDIMTSKRKSGKANTSDRPDTPTKNEKHIRPIIHNFLGDTNQKPVRTQSLNIKSVTFSQDTVFNEDKTKRYRKERVSLRNVYRSRVSGSEVYAKINPLFEDDSDEGEGYVTKGSNQSLQERRGSFVYLGDDETSPNENAEGDSPIDKAVLNFPSYMQRFLQNDSNSTTDVAKVTGGNNSEASVSEIQGSFRDQPNEKLSSLISSIKSSEKLETAETPTIKITSSDKDEDHIALGPDVPGYDVLIKKTIAKQQHRFYMKCSLAILFVCGLLVIIAIIVYFLIIKRYVPNN